MIRAHRIIFLALLMLLMACSNNSDENKPKAEATVPPPTPTSLLTSRFNGPLLNPAKHGEASSCLAGSDCGLGVATDVETALALPLTLTVWQGLQIGVPEGFDALDFETRLAIETTDVEKYEGNFRVSVQWATAEEVEKLLQNYANIDLSKREEHSTAIGEGYIIPNNDMGMIGVWTSDDERMVVVEGFVQPGYWPRYAATYMAIIDNLAITESR